MTDQPAGDDRAIGDLPVSYARALDTDDINGCAYGPGCSTTNSATAAGGGDGGSSPAPGSASVRRTPAS